jgi:hypothetical protein
VAGAFLAGLSCHVQAGDVPPDANSALVPASATPPPLALRGSAVLDGRALAAHRGGTAVASDMQLHGVVTGNRATDVATGSNRVASGAFAGAAGLPVVIQNSGNNVLIQNATIVNLQLR